MVTTIPLSFDWLSIWLEFRQSVLRFFSILFIFKIVWDGPSHLVLTVFYSDSSFAKNIVNTSIFFLVYFYFLHLEVCVGATPGGIRLPKWWKPFSSRGSPLPPFPGEPATRSRGGTSFPRLPLAELGGGARSFAGGTKSCCVGRAWHSRAAAGGILKQSREESFGHHHHNHYHRYRAVLMNTITR